MSAPGAEPVRLVRAGALGPGQPTPGMIREEAFATERSWTGLVHTEPGAVSGWHHHDGHETTIHLLVGAMRLDFLPEVGPDGPGRIESLHAGPGDFLFVPAHTVHREANPGGRRSTAVLLRCGSGAVVVAADGPAG